MRRRRIERREQDERRSLEERRAELFAIVDATGAAPFFHKDQSSPHCQAPDFSRDGPRRGSQENHAATSRQAQSAERAFIGDDHPCGRDGLAGAHGPSYSAQP
jgi:hypothetical protein